MDEIGEPLGAPHPIEAIPTGIANGRYGDSSRPSPGLEAMGKTRQFRPFRDTQEIVGFGTHSMRTASAGTIAPNSLLAGKIQGILPISPVGRSRTVQNVSIITIIHEKIPGTFELGKFRVSSGIELGNQSSVWQGASLRLVGSCTNRR